MGACAGREWGVRRAFAGRAWGAISVGITRSALLSGYLGNDAQSFPQVYYTNYKKSRKSSSYRKKLFFVVKK